MQQAYADEGHDEAADCDEEHRQRVALRLWSVEALPRGDENPSGHGQQRKAVDQRSEDLGAIEAVCSACRRWTSREPDGRNGHCEAQHVAEQVAAVGQQRQRPG